MTTHPATAPATCPHTRPHPHPGKVWACHYGPTHPGHAHLMRTVPVRLVHVGDRP